MRAITFFDGLMSPQFIRFLLVGGTGTLLNLGLSWLVTSLFGIEQYVWGIVVGLSVNILYNFALYTHAVFKTQGNHGKRIVIFSAYSVCIAGLYVVLVRAISSLVGTEYYLYVSLVAILFFAVVNYVVLKWSIFRTAVTSD
jgi:putative flippase GtrA